MRTTLADNAADRAPDLLNRDFTATAPNRVWVTDFTYCRTWSGFVYTAFIVDVFAQRIIAWHCQTSKVVDLVMIALRIAIWDRDREGSRTAAGELVYHSCAGSQFRSKRFRKLLRRNHTHGSMGRIGTCADNAAMESCFSLLQKLSGPSTLDQPIGIALVDHHLDRDDLPPKTPPPTPESTNPHRV